MSNDNRDSNKQVAEKLGLHHSSTQRKRRQLIIAGVVILLVGGVGWRIQGQRAKNEAVQYETMPVTRGDLVETVNATGTLAPVNEVEIGSEISGTLLTVDVTYNDHVTNGQVLARIDTSKLEAQVRQSEASLEAAEAKVVENEATLHEAESQLARLRQVHERSGGQIPSRNELDAQEATVLRARANVASAKAEIAKAEATLKVTLSDVEKAVIISPINGIVLDRKIEPGQTVAASFEAPVLFTLAEDLTKLELQVDVDEADVGRVHEGQEAAFNVDAYPDRNFPATITQVRYGSKTTDGVVTYTTVLNVSNDDLSLRPGMTATATITTRKVSDVLLAPNTALRFEPPRVETAAPNGQNNGSKPSLISSIMPRPPRRDRNMNNGDSKKTKPPTVYLLEGQNIRPVLVTTGFSDGINTQVTSDELAVGSPLVVSERVRRK